MAQPGANHMVLGPDCWIKGQMNIGGDLQLHGTFEGEIHVGGTMEVRETATLKGLARAGAMRVSGRVDADLVGEQGVALLEGCHVTGRIFSPRLLAVKGATLRGEVNIGPDALSQAPGEAWPQVLKNTPVEQQASDAEARGVIEQPTSFATEPVSQLHEDSRVAVDQNSTSAQTTETSISVAAALDDADDMAEAEPEIAADISTVPHSIRSVLQRRSRLTNLTSPPRRTA